MEVRAKRSGDRRVGTASDANQADGARSPDPSKRWGIGGSDVPAIVGVDLYGRTPLALFEEKLGLRPGLPDGLPWLDRGRRLEPVVAEMFQERHPELDVQPPSDDGNLAVHPTKPFLFAHLDRLLLGEVGAGVGILEIKHADLATFRKVEREGLPYAWIAQWQHYSLVTGLRWGYFAVLNAEKWLYLDVPMEADDRLQAALLTLEERFWRCVQNGTPPASIVVGEDDRPKGSNVYYYDDGRDGDPQGWAAAVQQWREAELLEETAELAKAEAREGLMGFLGSRYGVHEGAGARIHWQKLSRKGNIDMRSLEISRPLDRLAVVTRLGPTLQDLKVLTDAIRAGECDVDLDSFRKPSTDYEALRVTQIRETQEEVP